MENEPTRLRAHLQELMVGSTEIEILEAEERVTELASILMAYAEEHNIEIDTTLTDSHSDASVKG